jgi:hypothetical protein
MEEIYKSIKNYEGYYQVSNLGNVMSMERKARVKGGMRTVRARVLSPSTDKFGYRRVQLSKCGIIVTHSVHKLVLQTFSGIYYEGGSYRVCDHIDNNPSNNRLDNLQWLTPRKNSSKDLIRGNDLPIGVHKNKVRGVYVASILYKKKKLHLGSYPTPHEAELAYKHAVGKINEGFGDSLIKPCRDLPKGVRKRGKKYMARVTVGGKEVHLGMFKTIEEASEARLRHLT